MFEYSIFNYDLRMLLGAGHQFKGALSSLRSGYWRQLNFDIEQIKWVNDWNLVSKMCGIV